ncbi:GSCOCG00004116001-RA-CDS [Cotesia congregata]|nr:GSCOCG00004116001-RA-CDS [Cotesia congregata]
MLIDSKNDLNVLIEILLCGTFITSTLSKEWRKDDDPPLLPDIASPIHYIIKISPNIEDEKNLTFDGESVIDFEIKDVTEVLTLNAKNLKIIGEVSVRDQNRKWATQDYSIDSKTDFLSIKFNEKLPKGNFTLYIFYSGKINTRPIKGLVYNTYDDESDDEQWLLFSNFGTNFAREIMPCWDDPSTLATFEISIRHNRKYTAVSNTQFDSIMSDGKKFNYVWTHFEKTPRLSVRTVAFAMGDLEYLSDDSNAYRVWTPKNAKNHRKFFATIGGKAWRAMENITGIHHEDYVLKKIDVVVIPAPEEWDMLFWGLSILSKQNIPNDGYGNIETRNKFLISISQLLYDQWILNADITLEKFDNSFLNIDLRRYVAVCMADQIEQSWDIKEKYFHNIQDQPNRMGFITRTVANIFGPYKFRNILRRFIVDNKFGGSKSVNLIDEYALASESEPMKVFLKKALINWMSTQGYPVIYVDKNEANGTIITQSRFKANEFTKSTDRYWIPISCATQDYPNFEDLSDIIWFDPDSPHLSIFRAPQNSWIICNKREFGDYRVNYDKSNWELIINYLQSNDHSKIHPLNRAQLIDDAFVLASTKYIDYDVPLKLMGYLHRETDYHPWVEFWRRLQHLYYNSPLRNSQYYEDFKGYLLKQTSKMEADVLVDVKSYQDVHYLTKFQKASILKWACKF